MTLYVFTLMNGRHGEERIGCRWRRHRRAGGRARREEAVPLRQTEFLHQ